MSTHTLITPHMHMHMHTECACTRGFSGEALEEAERATEALVHLVYASDDGQHVQLNVHLGLLVHHQVGRVPQVAEACKREREHECQGAQWHMQVHERHVRVAGVLVMLVAAWAPCLCINWAALRLR
jgi:hypothetical protein